MANTVNSVVNPRSSIAKHFIGRKRGNIVNIGSTASHRGAPNGTAYYASKAALRIMTECWRAELRQHNIRVFFGQPQRGDYRVCGGLRILPKG